MSEEAESRSAEGKADSLQPFLADVGRHKLLTAAEESEELPSWDESPLVAAAG